MARRRILDEEEQERLDAEEARRARVVEEETERLKKAGKKMKGFANHLIAFVVVMALVVPLNTMLRPDEPWYLVLGIGWGLIIAIHLIVATGVLSKKKTK